ncbi:MAG: glucose-6-phosphate isomerase [Candidatus Glassbacteria bacterium]|nr:glucose-6-phosphate isomerase [Candidatus Glassbacteria bacterium]
MSRWRSRKWQRRMSLKLDFNYMMSEFLGEANGISEDDLRGMREVAVKLHNELSEGRAAGRIGFYDLPYDEDTVESVEKFARKAIRRYENVVLLGIGGSSLGPRALHSALAGGQWANLADHKGRGKIPRFFFADNIDPETFGRILEFAELKKTLFLVVTKSGTTAETMSQFLIVHDMLERKLGRGRVADHLVAVTDAQNGRLRNVADREGLTDFIIPDNVGGRFSIFTPVGLLPAALMGIDIRQLLAGAAAMDERTKKADLHANPAYVAAVLLFLAERTHGRNIDVMFSYSDALFDVADWFRQLWAESLGKKHSLGGKEVYCGLTPVRALGVTDQHSQTQLYMEGPFDKVTIFLAVDQFDKSMPIPTLYEDLPDLHYLGGHSLEELFQAERAATEYAMLQAGRPSMTITVPQVNAFTLGQLFYMLEVQTAFAGGLYNIDPFDQPGVELGKKLTYGMMGRQGYESLRTEYENRQAKQDKYVV